MVAASASEGVVCHVRGDISGATRLESYVVVRRVSERAAGDYDVIGGPARIPDAEVILDRARNHEIREGARAGQAIKDNATFVGTDAGAVRAVDRAVFDSSCRDGETPNTKVLVRAVNGHAPQRDVRHVVEEHANALGVVAVCA